MTQAWPTYPAPRKLALVVSCVDYRLLDDIVSYLHLDNMTNRYYHFAIAGTALGLVDCLREGDFQPPTDQEIADRERMNIRTKDELLHKFSCWSSTFKDQVAAGLLLTKNQISDIYLIQHENCGAFRIYLDKNIEERKDTPKKRQEYELEMHKWYADQVKKGIAGTAEKVADELGYCKSPGEINVHTLFMTLRGEVIDLSTLAGNGHKDGGSKKKPKDKKSPKKDN